MDFKPILFVTLTLVLIGFFMGIFVNPHFSSVDPNPSSALYGLVDFVENGVSYDLPVLGTISFNPASWLWLGIDAVTDYFVDTLTSLTYLPNVLSIPLVVLLVIAFIFVVISLISGLIPFT